MPKKNSSGSLISFGNVADNRKARFNYEIISDFETGIALLGSEVKALRLGRCAISDSHAAIKKEELYLLNLHIGEHAGTPKKLAHEAKRPRKLLVKKRELKKLIGQIQREGMTLVPLNIYFNNRGKAKVKLGLAKGKKMTDKRETIKQREWDRSKARILKES